MQLAAATAAKGTSRPANGGRDLTIAFKPKHLYVNKTLRKLVFNICASFKFSFKRQNITTKFPNAFLQQLQSEQAGQLPKAVPNAPPVAAAK